MLPDWPPGTPAILIVAGLHAIPVSTAMRRGEARIVLALGGRRETLKRLRAEPDVALAVLAEGVAFTAYGRATVLRDELDAAPVAAVEISVESVADHLADGRTKMIDGPRWEWLDPGAAESDTRIRVQLERL